MDQVEIQILVFVVTVVILVLVTSLVLFFYFFQQKKTTLLIEKRETKKRFEQEINNSKLEIQEQALKNISWEIHDNIGQLLSVAKMQLNIVQMSVPDAQKEQLQETGTIVGKSLEDLRGLAKSLNPETIKNNGLVDSLELEMQRFNRLNVIDASLKIIGDTYHLNNEKEIILFRILQEFCNNTLKYAKAKKLIITLKYNKDNLEITAEDNGVGFNITDTSKQHGIGLLNIRSRGKLIGAKIDLNSKENLGTKLYISCPK
ncbi:histidine kinase [Lutibacter sp. A80]|uniref:sensor histidine kinase n=1 Tax=Lutibacter sp. A80 TaxID=2918453 RepID=UPI001F05D4C7|nr:ATP-binding protein [Lutibacter sp. A80]UMB59533.1 histidine kinase [Lutibacter sp. A80]